MSSVSAVDIPGAVQRLRSTFESGKTRDLAWRRQQLQNLSRLIEENTSEFEACLEADLGHQGQYFSGVIEGGQMRGELKTALDNLDKWVQPTQKKTPLVLQPGKSFVQREPYGVVLIISPWNFPLSLLLGPLVGAIAAGNAVLMKPSEVSPATSSAIAKLIPKYMDKDAFIVIEGGVTETSEILKQKFDLIMYTGNTAVGKIVMKAAAEHLTPVLLELGGKSPTIIDKTANLDVAARRIVWGKFLNSGQICIAPDYLMVDKSVASPLVEKMKKVLKDFYGEDPQKSKDYSRVINFRHVERLSALIEKSKAQSTIAVGGQVDLKDRYVAPTIVEGVKFDHPLMEEEIFGPILPVITYESMEEAINYINSKPRPLALYVFSTDTKAQETVMNRTLSGATIINDVLVHATNMDLPFGGIGNSGLGNYHGDFSFKAFSYERAILKKSNALDLSIRYPPYTASKISQMKSVANMTIGKLLFGLSAATVVGLAVAIAAYGPTAFVNDVRESFLVGLKALMAALEK